MQYGCVDKLNDEITVRVQRMFPNCEKYTKCCSDSDKFWKKLDDKVKMNKPKTQPFRVTDVVHPNMNWCAESRAYLDDNKDDEFGYEYALIEREVKLP